jgi:hypothetical protein
MFVQVFLLDRVREIPAMMLLAPNTLRLESVIVKDPLKLTVLKSDEFELLITSPFTVLFERTTLFVFDIVLVRPTPIAHVRQSIIVLLIEVEDDEAMSTHPVDAPFVLMDVPAEFVMANAMTGYG